MRTRKRGAEGEQTPESVSGGGKRARKDSAGASAAPVETAKPSAAPGARRSSSRAAAQVDNTLAPQNSTAQGASGSSRRGGGSGKSRAGKEAEASKKAEKRSSSRNSANPQVAEGGASGSRVRSGKSAKGSAKPARRSPGSAMASREELETMRQEAYDRDDLDEEEDEEDDDVEEEEDEDDEEDEEDEEDEDEDDEDGEGGDDPTGLQALLRRLGGGLEDLLPNAGAMNSRLKQILAGLRAEGDDMRQVAALNELCEVLVISSEESLITLSLDAFVPVLVNLMQAEYNPDAMLLAARALTSMADILPNSRGAIIHYGALPAFCSRLLTIEYIDLAEQSLQALEKLSQEHGASCLREGGMMACLSYLDFFSLGMQRVALQTAANICRQLPSSDCWDQVSDSVPTLTNLLMHDDSRLVENACTCLTLMAAKFSSRPQRLQEMCAHGLIPNAMRLISPGASQVSPSTYHGLIRLIGTCCRGSADVAEQLLRNGMPSTLKTTLAGCKVLSTSAASPASPVVSADQLLEVTTLANQLLPSIRADAGGCAASSPLATLGIDAAVPSRRRGSASGDEAAAAAAAAEAATAAGLALEGILRSEPELLREYGANLSAALMQVTTASIGTDVKLQCLAALAKFLHHAPPEMLAEGDAAINPGQMASFLAGLLSVRDAVMKEKYAVVEVVLFVVDLLMHKLPDIFSRAFRKEGTVRAVEVLCEQRVDSEAAAEAAAAKGAGKGSGGNVTPRDQVVPSGVGGGSAASIVAKMALSGAKKPSDTPQRRAAVDRAVALREAHFAAASGGEAEGRLRDACAPLRDAGSDPVAAAAVAVKFLAALDEGEGASTFELIECGGIEALDAFFSGRDLPRGDAWSAAVAARLSAFVRAASVDLPPKTVGGLVQRLLDALAVTESMPMRLSAGSSSGSGGSRGGSSGAAGDGLGVLARPFKLRLCRASGQRAGLKDYASNIILVEPLATLNAIEDFLFPRVHRQSSAPAAGASGSAGGGANGAPARQSSGGADRDENAKRDDEPADEPEEKEDEEMFGEDGDEGEGDGEAPPADAVEDVDPAANGEDVGGDGNGVAPSGTAPAAATTAAAAAAAAARPRLLFHAPGAGPFHPTMSVLQAVHAAALAEVAAANGGDAGQDREDGEGSKLSTASLWGRTHALQYMLTPEGEPLPPPPPGAGGLVGVTDADATDADEALAALGPSDRRAALGGVLPALRGKLCGATPPPGLTDQSSAILSVLSVLHTVSASAPRILALSDDVDGKVTSTMAAAALALPSDAFLSSKLSGKLVRQLGDTLSLCSGSLPAWCAVLSRSCPFLFPFEVRQQLFYCTTFGLARALHRMHGQAQENGAGGGGNGRDLRVGRLQRQKVRVSRERILESAVKVFDMAPAHKMVLEVEYFNEVGTGTGPTLEFYTLLSKELTRRSLGAWRDAPRGETSPDDEPYVHAPHGLFPAPIRPGAPDVAAPKSPGGLTRVELFRLLGRVVGKALQDGRLLDLGLSPAFFRAAAGRTLAVADVAEIDPELGRTLAQLAVAARRVDALRSAGAPEAQWRAVDVAGAAIEDLCLSFVLPGDESFELRPEGAGTTVDASNLGEYVDAVVDAVVGGGVARQMDAFRSGLSDIMPPAALGVFSEAELDSMLCGQGQAWTPEVLTECVTFDHGYTAQSPPIKALMEVLCGYGPQEQRAFLRFVTGAPRLPPGGLAALQPRLTVVCKQPSGAAGGAGAGGQPISAGTTLADKDLPSAMTCASYLKLPPYSCVEVLRERLGYAITEGVGSFDLS